MNIPPLYFDATNGASFSLSSLSTTLVYNTLVMDIYITCKTSPGYITPSSKIGKAPNFRHQFRMELYQTNVLPLHEWIRLGLPISLPPCVSQETPSTPPQTHRYILWLQSPVCRGGWLHPTPRRIGNQTVPTNSWRHTILCAGRQQQASPGSQRHWCPS